MALKSEEIAQVISKIEMPEGWEILVGSGNYIGLKHDCSDTVWRYPFPEEEMPEGGWTIETLEAAIRGKVPILVIVRLERYVLMPVGSDGKPTGCIVEELGGESRHIHLSSTSKRFTGEVATCREHGTAIWILPDGMDAAMRARMELGDERPTSQTGEP